MLKERKPDDAIVCAAVEVHVEGAGGGGCVVGVGDTGGVEDLVDAGGSGGLSLIGTASSANVGSLELNHKIKKQVTER